MKKLFLLTAILIAPAVYAGPHRGIVLTAGGGGNSVPQTWTDKGVFVSTQNNVSQDPWVVTTTQDLNIGDVAICIAAVDNDGDGTDTNDINLPVDSASNLWVQDAENETDPAAGAAGAFIGVYHTLSTSTLVSGGTITFDFDSAKIAKSLVCKLYGVGTVVSISTAGTLQKEDAVGDAGPLTLGSLSSAEYLWIRAIASEAIDGSIASLTAGFSSLLSLNGGSGIADSSSMSVAAESIVATGTTQTSDPTMTTITAIDRASVMVAFKRN